MKDTQDFLNIKNAMLNEGLSKKQTYDTLYRMLRKYSADIADEEFLSRERILKSERFSLFCVIQSLKVDIEKKPSFNTRYSKNDQMKIAA